MLFLTAIYEEMSLSYSVLGLTEKECRAVMNEKIAAAALLWLSLIHIFSLLFRQKVREKVG